MTKNKLEKKFIESLKADIELWGMKLHNNPLSHQTTPGDYIISSMQIEFGANSKATLKLHIVECKQITLDKNGKGRLAFKRLKQMHDLLSFQGRRELHCSWFCIAYKELFWTESDIYLIPADKLKMIMEDFIDHLDLVSINREKAAEHFSEYKVPIINGYIDLSCLKQA